jgi:hypothetical protein
MGRLAEMQRKLLEVWLAVLSMSSTSVTHARAANDGA